MAKNERRCRANLYTMRVENGVEVHNRQCSIGGKDMTGTPTDWAHTGEYPNYKREMPFSEAYHFFEERIGGYFMSRSGMPPCEYLKRAYVIDSRSKYDELAKGDAFYIVAIDFVYEGGGVERRKIIFTKA